MDVTRMNQVLKNILEIAFVGGPDGRADRLTMISRMAKHALENPENCSSCAHFDQDCHCALPIQDQIISYIGDPLKVVCAKWEKRDNGGYGHGV
jgi:hypothetical protein